MSKLTAIIRIKDGQVDALSSSPRLNIKLKPYRNAEKPKETVESTFGASCNLEVIY